MSFIESVRIFIFGRSSRNKKLKHHNLNESNLARQTYETSSEEEESSLENKVKQSNTFVENYSQTGLSLRSNSYRSASEPNSDFDKSSVYSEEDFHLDDIEVSRTDKELGIEENLENLSLAEAKTNEQKHTFKANKIGKSQSLGNIWEIEEKNHGNYFASCPNLVNLRKFSIKINISRQREILENNLALVPYLPETGKSGKHTPASLTILHKPRDLYNQAKPYDPKALNRPTTLHYPNTKETIDKIIGEINFKDRTSKVSDSHETNNRTYFGKFTGLTLQGYRNYKDYLKLQSNISDLKARANELFMVHEQHLNFAKENTKILDETLGKYKKHPSEGSGNVFRSKNTINMAVLSAETNKILKRIPNISSEDPKSEIRENVEKLRHFGKRVPQKEASNFIESLSTIFDCAIREAVESAEIESIDDLCDLIIKKFVLKGNYDKKLDELKRLKKKSSESYTDFGTRIIKFKNDLIKMARYKDDDNKFLGRQTNIEDEALKIYLKSLRKHLSLVFKYGDPKNIQEAREFVEKAEERFEFSDEEESDEEEKIKGKKVNKTGISRLPSAKCQSCNMSLSQNPHEALTCTLTACVYCESSLHISNACTVANETTKIKMICKLCSSPTHTIDLCPDKIPRTTYCQYCQSSSCYATRCEKIEQCKVCAICGGKPHPYGTNCHMNNTNINMTQQQGPRRGYGPCWGCQGPHNLNRCPQRQNNQNQQLQISRGGRTYYRGNQNRGYQGNQNEGRTVVYNNPAPNPNFYGNQGQYRGNGAYRGGRGGYNPNYRGRQNYQNNRNPNIDRLATLLESWMSSGQANNDNSQPSTSQLPSISYPQNEPKN